MRIFEKTNSKYFYPLVNKQAEIYAESMRSIVQEMEETPELLDSSSKAIIRNIIRKYGNDDFRKDPGEVLRKLRDSGWIEEEEVSRSGQYVTNITMNGIRIVEFMSSFDEAGRLSATDIFSLYDNAKYLNGKDTVRNQYYAHILHPMQKNVQNIKSALIHLKNNVRSIMKELYKRSSYDVLMKYISGDEVDDMFKDYYFIKRGGFANDYMSDVVRELRRFMSDETRMQKAAAEYENANSEDDLPGITHINNIILSMINFLEEIYPEYMSEIDQKMIDCHKAMYKQIAKGLRLTNGSDPRILISELMGVLQNAKQNENEKIIGQVSECIKIYDQKYVCSKSVTPYKRTSNDSVKIPFTESDLENETLEKQSKDLIGNKKRVTRKGAEKFVKRLFKNNQKTVIPKPHDIHSREEGLFIPILQSMIGEQKNESEYEVVSTGKKEHGDHLEYDGVEIIRKE